MKIIHKEKKHIPGGTKETIKFLSIPVLKKYNTSLGKKTYVLGIKIRDKYLPLQADYRETQELIYVLELRMKILEASLREMTEFEEKLKSRFPELVN